MLCQAILSFLRPLKRVGERGFEILFESGENWKCLLRIISYGCDIPEANGMSGARYGAGRQILCVRCHSSNEDNGMDRRDARRVLAKTMKTQRNVKELQGKTRSLVEKGCSTRRRRYWMR